MEFGELDCRTFKFLDILADEGRVTLQLYCQLESKDDPSDRKRPRSSRARAVNLSVIIYGCLDVFDLVGDFMSRSKMFLQEPQHCDRNVRYRNPHRLSWTNDEDKYTQSLDTPEQVPIDIKAFEALPDLLAEFGSQDSLLETEVSPTILGTPLYR
jgi:SWI/SNF-related matrix-associated actin-dependent regulator of chromatin subfamily A3